MRANPRKLISLFCALAALGRAAAAQQPDTGAVRVTGSVLRQDGSPVPRATVLVLDSGDSTLTLADGRFILTTRARGLVTLVARRLGSVPATADLMVPASSDVRLTLIPAPPVISAMRIEAPGEYRIGSATTATLSPLDIAQTPGAAANVARAMQTLPGAQNVDEGTGLFVRGGDVTETRVLVDDVVMLSPARFDNPTGHVTTSLNPFLLSRATFSSGGFGVAYGNALSGLVRLETAGRPSQATGSLTAAVGSLGAAGAVPVGPRVGVRASAGLTNLGPLVQTFGQNQPFDPPPRGGDASIAAEWQTSAAGRVRLFALRQQQSFGVGQADRSGTSGYRGDVREGLTVLSWRDSLGWLRPSVALGESGFSRAETFGGFAQDTRLVARHAVASVRAVISPWVSLVVGVDDEMLRTRYAGRITSGGVPRDVFGYAVPSGRRGTMGEVTWRAVPSVQVVAGVRTDRASLPARRTMDPRVAVSWAVRGLGLTASWGRFTQVAEPVFWRGNAFAPMRVEQATVGLQRGTDTVGLRIELWSKRWTDLHQFTPTFGVRSGGIGTAHGADVQLRWRFGPASQSRVSWSTLVAERTDPATGRMAPAPSDVRHSVAWITDRMLGPVTLSSALRWATGRPFTDIVGATGGPGAWAPVYGDPFATRLPSYLRSDLSASWVRPMPRGPAMVLWGSLANVFARDNIMRYTWSADFRERRPVRAPFNRSLYVGATLLF
jgi:vitamin B12 transporter